MVLMLARIDPYTGAMSVEARYIWNGHHSGWRVGVLGPLWQFSTITCFSPRFWVDHDSRSYHSCTFSSWPHPSTAGGSRNEKHSVGKQAGKNQ